MKIAKKSLSKAELIEENDSLRKENSLLDYTLHCVLHDLPDTKARFVHDDVTYRISLYRCTATHGGIVVCSGQVAGDRPLTRSEYLDDAISRRETLFPELRDTIDRFHQFRKAALYGPASLAAAAKSQIGGDL